MKAKRQRTITRCCQVAQGPDDEKLASMNQMDHWSDADQHEYARLLDLSEDKELTEPERAKLKDLYERKIRHLLRDPEIKHMTEQLEKSIALVDDMVADGANFTSSEKAEMTMLLYKAEDKMIQRYTLIKKAGRAVGVGQK